MQKRSGIYVSLSILLSIAMLGSPVYAQGKSGKGGGGSDGGGDPPTPLPAVRYQLTFPKVPVEATGGQWINDINNIGQVVGYFWTNGTIGKDAFVYDPAWDEAVLLKNLVDTSNLPDGFILSSAIGINDYGVIVGYLENATGDRLPFAVDLSLPSPVVDLLPSAGMTYSMARKINNAGEIVGYYGDGSGATPGVGSTWLLDASIYGIPSSRVMRDGDVDGVADQLPLDMSQDSPVLLGSLLGPTSTANFISNPGNGSPGVITGSTEGTLFRLSTSSFIPEFIPDLDSASGPAGIDSQNSVVGRGSVPSGKRNRRTTVNYRYSQFLEVLPATGSPSDVNDAGEILLDSNTGGSIFRDWFDGNGPREVNIADLLVGSDADLELLFSADNFGCTRISNGAIAGGAYYSTTGVRKLVVLFEVNP